MGGTVPGMEVLDSIRKQIEQDLGTKPVSIIPPWKWCSTSLILGPSNTVAQVVVTPTRKLLLSLLITLFLVLI